MAKPSLDHICKCGHLRGEHFRRVCTMSVDECERPCECNRFRLDYDMLEHLKAEMAARSPNSGGSEHG